MTSKEKGCWSYVDLLQQSSPLVEYLLEVQKKVPKKWRKGGICFFFFGCLSKRFSLILNSQRSSPKKVVEKPRSRRRSFCSFLGKPKLHSTHLLRVNEEHFDSIQTTVDQQPVFDLTIADVCVELIPRYEKPV